MGELGTGVLTLGPTVVAGSRRTAADAPSVVYSPPAALPVRVLALFSARFGTLAPARRASYRLRIAPADLLLEGVGLSVRSVEAEFGVERK